jgi:hypothetical protein
MTAPHETGQCERGYFEPATNFRRYQRSVVAANIEANAADFIVCNVVYYHQYFRNLYLGRRTLVAMLSRANLLLLLSQETADAAAIIRLEHRVRFIAQHFFYCGIATCNRKQSSFIYKLYERRQFANVRWHRPHAVHCRPRSVNRSVHMVIYCCLYACDFIIPDAPISKILRRLARSSHLDISSSVLHPKNRPSVENAHRCPLNPRMRPPATKPRSVLRWQAKRLDHVQFRTQT